MFISADLPCALHRLIHEAVLLEACDLLRHSSSNGLPQLVNRILHMGSLLLGDTSRQKHFAHWPPTD